jgi:predicted PurR-regulated permease PerM
VQAGDNTDRIAWFFQLATFALIVAVLRLAEDVLLPLAFAVLLAFLLSPLVIRLMRWGFPRAIAITTAVVIAFSVIGGLGWIVTVQAINLVRELPNYEQNIQQKIAALKQPHTPAAVSRMTGMIENLRKEIRSAGPLPKQPPAQPADEPKPVPVEVHAAEPTPLEIARDIVSPILGPLGVAGIVIVFVVAILFQREDLRDRFIKMVGAGKLNVATQAIDDAARRVSRYLGMQLVVNATYGIPVGIGLYFIGIPNAPLWGLLATLLRFIPFVGPWIAAAFPIALSVAVDPGWTKVLYVVALFVAMELVSNNLIEVVLYGASTGISNFALLVAAVFWTWLWGAPGLVLSTPLTVCLLVLGNYVPGFKILSMLLGSEPVLEPPAQFYQRMLSMESEDMVELATKFVGSHSLLEFYDDVFVPALLMSEQDRHSGALTGERQRFIFQSSRELIDELERQDESARQEQQVGGLSTPPAPQPVAPLVLGVPARDDADEIVAQMLCHLLRQRGIPAAVAPFTTKPDEIAGLVRQHGVRALFISALPPSAVVGARQLWRRLQAQHPAASAVVGVWRHHAEVSDLTERLHLGTNENIVTTLASALENLQKLVRPPAPDAADRTPHTAMPVAKIAAE